MKVSDLVALLEAIAPTRYAESWDNVGLLAGDPKAEVKRVLLTIDCTDAVLDEAEGAPGTTVVAYHPPIFQPLKRVTAGSVVFRALRAGIALYSPHTALDVAPGGTNDVLADALGLEERAPLRPLQPKDAEYKLVTFVPEDALEKVSRALFDAGAGVIGNYSSCSFRAPGTGTFYGEEGASPRVGEALRLEQVAEMKLEMVLPIAKVEPALAALRRAHPYEEPAFDLVRLAKAPPPGFGMGRVGNVPPCDRAVLIERIKSALGVTRLLVAGPTSGEVRRAAVCAGACGDLYRDAVSARADLYLTGEMRHHDALAASKSMTVVCALHSNSERIALAALEGTLRERAPTLDILRSRADADPFAIC
jgi:dinuclear metal center YbgI/SA1388 family protein